jgi:monoamine oxidase
MSMSSARVAIVGGGLSGLYAAYLLEQHGLRDYVLLEARSMVGGRITSAGIENAFFDARRNRFDLGPAWFWPAFQPELDRLVSDLCLERFEQHGMGDMLVERSPHEPPLRTAGYAMSPLSMRLVGGMGALVDALREKLPAARIVTDRQVHRLRLSADRIELDARSSQGQSATYEAERILIAIPPRLAATSIDFMPSLPAPLHREWNSTSTWMAAHAKYVAIYDAPFWREQGLSGEARSVAGPLAEIHDASMLGGQAALFGFLGMPARMRGRLTEEELRVHCRAQLARIFGPAAGHPLADMIKDWAADPLTATAADQDDIGGHGGAPSASAQASGWSGVLTGIASEWSPHFPGYLAGAIEAARLGVQSMTTAATGAP